MSPAHSVNRSWRLYLGAGVDTLVVVVRGEWSRHLWIFFE
jgi:hypothetical protein